MSYYCSVLPKQKRHLLVFGYTRQHNTHNTPFVISQLCLKYHNDAIHWQVKGDQLAEFYNYEAGQYLNGPSFELKNISLELDLRPDQERRVNYVCGYVKKLFPSNIDKFIMLIKFFCDEIEYECRLTTVFGSGYYRCASWNANNLNLVECKNKYTQLSFGCYVEMLHIFYSDDKQENFTQNIEMHAEYKYEWNLNENELKRFKTAAFNYTLYSKEFNNNCCSLLLTPNGSQFKQDSKGCVCVTLKIHKFPYDVKCIDVKYEIEIKSERNQSCFEGMGKFKYSASSKYNKDLKIPFSMYSNAECLSVTLNMKIVAVQDRLCKDDTFVSIDEWGKKGFI